MTVAIQTAAEAVAAQRDAFAGRLFGSALGAADLLTIYLGDRLGLYRALDDDGPTTPGRLAARTGLQERYVREWLEQQAVTGILEVDDAGAEASARRYRLPAGHAEVLLDHTSLAYLAPLAPMAFSLARQAPAVLTAFQEGGGVAWHEFGADAREAQAALNRPVFHNLLAREWLPALPDVHARLQADPSAAVADIACGAGWSSIAIARAYPKVRVDGFDLDEPSILLARAHAVEAGVADRVTFHVRDAADPEFTGRYELVTVCEALHDMSQPVEALRTMRRLRAADGVVLVLDERVAEAFTAPGDDVERFMYGCSVLCCLPVGLSEAPSAGTGTVMRPATLRRYATEAGFTDLEILPIAHDFFRLYRLIA